MRILTVGLSTKSGVILKEFHIVLRIRIRIIRWSEARITGDVFTSQQLSSPP